LPNTSQNILKTWRDHRVSLEFDSPIIEWRSFDAWELSNISKNIKTIVSPGPLTAIYPVAISWCLRIRKIKFASSPRSNNKALPTHNGTDGATNITTTINCSTGEHQMLGPYREPASVQPTIIRWWGHIHRHEGNQHTAWQSHNILSDGFNGGLKSLIWDDFYVVTIKSPHSIINCVANVYEILRCQPYMRAKYPRQRPHSYWKAWNAPQSKWCKRPTINLGYFFIILCQLRGENT